MKIIAANTYYNEITDQLPLLKPDVVAATGKSFRRISRFIQLALIVSARCVKGRTLPDDTAIYFGSGAGDLGVSIDVMERLYTLGELPKPISFINTLSNASCFYIAQNFGLQGTSNFISSRCFSFERILSLAFKEYQLGKIKTALVTMVDSCVLPLSEQRRRLVVESDVALAEAAHCLLLGDEIEGGGSVLGEVQAVTHCVDISELEENIKNLDIDEQWGVAFGTFVSSSDQQYITKILSERGCSNVIGYRDNLSYYVSQTGALFDWLSPGSQLSESITLSKTILHISADETGRYCFIIIYPAHNV